MRLLVKKNKILYFCLPGIGDAIMMTPALKALRDSNPDAEISVLTMYRSVHQMMQSLECVDVSYLWDFFDESLIDSLKFVYQLRKNKFDATIMGFPANRREYSILSLLIGGKKRLGHLYGVANLSSFNFLYTEKVTKNVTRHNVVENLTLVELLNDSIAINEYTELSFPLNNKTMLFGDHWVKRELPQKSVIGIHPGSSTLKNHINKRWPKEYFAELVNILSDKGYGVVVVGGPEEDPLKEFVAGSKGVIATGTTLPETASIIRNCIAFVSNDSGMMHLAASQQTPVIGVYGPTSSVFAYPYSEHSKALDSDLPCAPCFGYSKKPLECAQFGDYRCLKGITVQRVLSSLEELI